MEHGSSRKNGPKRPGWSKLQGIEKELLEKRQQIREKAGDTEGLEEKKEGLLREKRTLETYIGEKEEQWKAFQERENRIGQEKASGEALVTEGEKELQKREASLSRHMTEEKVENISWRQAHRMEKEELEILEERKVTEISEEFPFP